MLRVRNPLVRTTLGSDLPPMLGDSKKKTVSMILRKRKMTARKILQYLIGLLMHGVSLPGKKIIKGLLRKLTCLATSMRYRHRNLLKKKKTEAKDGWSSPITRQRRHKLSLIILSHNNHLLTRKTSKLKVL
jgi:hypothetical protein